MSQQWINKSWQEKEQYKFILFHQSQINLVHTEACGNPCCYRHCVVKPDEEPLMFRCNSHKTNCTHYGPNIRGELSWDNILADAGENSTKNLL